MTKREPFSIFMRNSKSPESYYQRENELKEKVLFPLILQYYDKHPELLDTLREVSEFNGNKKKPPPFIFKRIQPEPVSKTGNISLRRLDALVSQNSEQNLCYYLYTVIDPNTADPFETYLLSRGVTEHRVPFNMNASYCQQLHHYQKRYFDSFRRRTKIELRQFQTSFCQLNFFIWLHQFDILRHVNEPKRKSQQLYLFLDTQYVPGIPKRQVYRKLLLRPELEYRLLQSTLILYRTLPLNLPAAPKRKKLLPILVTQS